MIVIDKNSCSDTIKKEVEIFDNPTAIYGINDSIQCFSDHNYTFDATGSKAGNGQKLSSVYWDFGSDSRIANATTDTVKNVTFRTSGYKKIRLIVGNANGCYDTIDFTLHIRPNPTAKFTVNNDTQCLLGHTFNFNSSNSTIITSVSSYQWSFGGASSNTQGNVANPQSIEYPSAGNKNIGFVLKDRNGCVDSTKLSIWIFENPKASISISSADSLCLRGNSWNLSSSNSNSISGLGISNYTWSTEETANATYTSSSVNGVKYASTGNKKLTLKIQDANGCWDTAYKTINVKPHPQADFSIVTAMSQCFIGNTFGFNAQKSASATNRISTFKWSLDTGASKTVGNVNSISNLTYRSVGGRIIQLIVVDNNGCTDTLTKSIEIKAHPEAIAKVKDNDQCINQNSFEYLGSDSR